MAKYLIDSYQRRISKLRLSVTDRCNLRCMYCFTEEPTFLPTTSILSYDEIITILHACDAFSIHTIRITGGEPLVRPHIISFLTQVRERFPHFDIRITTNGVYLEQSLAQLWDIGIRHLNISLDSFTPHIFSQITKKDTFHTVYNAICKSIEYGFTVKINAVAMKGYTDKELDKFIDFAYNNPVSVRFIEYMPIGHTTSLDDDIVWPTDDILHAIHQRVTLVPQEWSPESGPARVYFIAGGQGSIGVISPLTHHFCDGCDRLRITADGMIKTCLYSKDDISLRDALQAENPSHAIEELLTQVIYTKPRGIELLENRKNTILSGRSMNAIGG